jgi:hypothetical protein
VHVAVRAHQVVGGRARLGLDPVEAAELDTSETLEHAPRARFGCRVMLVRVAPLRIAKFDLDHGHLFFCQGGVLRLTAVHQQALETQAETGHRHCTVGCGGDFLRQQRDSSL